MNLLESLAMGMRSAAGVLSPDVQKITMAQDERQATQLEARKQLIAGQLIKMGENSADPAMIETLQARLKGLGYGDIPIAPSIDTQTKAIQLRKDAAARQYMQRPEVLEAVTSGDQTRISRAMAGLVALGVQDPMRYLAELRAEAKPTFAPRGSPGYYSNGVYTATPDATAGDSAKPTDAAKKQRELEAQGYPTDQARAIAYGFLKVVPTPNGVQLVRVDQALGSGPQPMEGGGPRVTSNLQESPEATWAQIRSIQDPMTQAQAAQAYRQQLQAQQAGRGTNAPLVPGMTPRSPDLPGSIGATPPATKTRIRVDGADGIVRMVNPEDGSSIVATDEKGEPLKTAKADTFGSREATFLNRVLISAAQVNKSLKNIVDLPMTASGGYFGGRQQGKSLFEAGKETLTNTMTTQEVQSYNVFATGITRSLAGIESAGLAPAASLTHMMNTVVFKEGDTNMTKLSKLAETRQIVEAGMETVLSNPRVPKETQAYAQKLLDELKTTVPFTPREVLRLQTLHMSNPNATLKDVMAQQSSGAPGLTPAEAERLKELEKKYGPK